MTYTIGEVAAMMDLPASTLRYYEEAGLLPDVSRTESGRRTYSEADLGLLRVIECLKRSGLSVKAMCDFVDMASKGDESIPGRLELFRERFAEVTRQIAELERTRRILEFKCWYYETAAKLGGEAAVQALPDSEVPEHLREVRAYLAPSE